MVGHNAIVNGGILIFAPSLCPLSHPLSGGTCVSLKPHRILFFHDLAFYAKLYGAFYLEERSGQMCIEIHMVYAKKSGKRYCYVNSKISLCEKECYRILLF